MPLTAKGNEIAKSMAKEYGPKKGEQVFYASKNAGTIAGVDRAPVCRADKGTIPNYDTAMTHYNR